MRRLKISTSFVNVILTCGLLASAAIAFNLSVFGLHRYPDRPYMYVEGGDAERGRRAVVRYGCTGCHVIPGVKTATGRVGPSLADIDRQMFIAGHLENTPENMIDWIRRPTGISPRTAMPDLGVSDQEARDIAAYLYAAARSVKKFALKIR